MLSYRSALGPCTSLGLGGRGRDDALRCGGMAQAIEQLGPAAALGPPQVPAMAGGREAPAERELLVLCGEADRMFEEAGEARPECKGDEEVGAG